MRSGYIIKSSSNGIAKDNELDLINQYSTKVLNREDVYVFSVILCDNDIDRDCERFTKESLEKLAKLFVGKTGIFDHEMRSENQIARTISCSVIEETEKTNILGEPYCKLVARCYLSKSEKNKDLILDIESGIKKEVSISCAVESNICSICGLDVKKQGCSHIKGTSYSKDGSSSICHVVLENPIDAYEWSFVAVPAQKNAGVTKKFKSQEKGGVFTMDDIIKKIKMGKGVNISSMQAQELSSFIAELEEMAICGKAYKNDLEEEVSRLYALNYADIDGETINNVTKKMNIEELKAFKKSFYSKMSKENVQKPQLSTLKSEVSQYKNIEFKI